MNLEEKRLIEKYKIGSVSFLGGFDESETYYLLEIDRDGDVKVIDSSIIKERLEAKAERYNELALEDKEYWKWKEVAHKYEVKTLEKGFYDKE